MSISTPLPRQVPWLRHAASAVALAAIAVVGLRFAGDYLNSPSIPRPPDFLQVWAAGHLTLSGDNPYDAKRMFEVQSANRSPSDYASMMWVPPWGLAVAMPIGALPINLAQVVWVFGQLVLIAVSSVALWQLYGGRGDRRWVPLVLAMLSGPVWWQTFCGQYAGLFLVGPVGFLAAHRANRPVLAGAFAALTALKPHLFLLLATGLLVDAVRTGFGRRVVLGGLLVLAATSAVVTAANPGVWSDYIAAATGPSSSYAPGLGAWFSPTVQAWVRHYVPGRPFWVQCVPAVVGVAAFGVYWWRLGRPDRWPAVLPWVIPASLLISPYGSWPSDLTLMLVPIIALAVRLDERNWTMPCRRLLGGVYAAMNIAVVVMLVSVAELQYYVWVGPALIGSMLWAYRSLGSGARPSRPRASETPAISCRSGGEVVA